MQISQENGKGERTTGRKEVHILHNDGTRVQLRSKWAKKVGEQGEVIDERARGGERGGKK